MHRTRSAWLATRTARINLVRGALREFGITIPVGARNVVPKVISLLDSSSIVPLVVRPVLESVCAEIRELEHHIRSVEVQLRLLVGDIPAAQRLMTVPGIGLLTATALVAFVGDVGRPAGHPEACHCYFLAEWSKPNANHLQRGLILANDNK